MATMTEDAFQNAVEDGSAIEVVSRPWRHGRRVTYKVEVDGKPYLATVDEHHEEGLMLCGDVPLRPARRVMIESWITDTEETTP